MTPKQEQYRLNRVFWLMSAFRGKADVQLWPEIHTNNVRFVPKADIRQSHSMGMLGYLTQGDTAFNARLLQMVLLKQLLVKSTLSSKIHCGVLIWSASIAAALSVT